MWGLSCAQLFATPWTVAHQAHPSMEFLRQEYWCGTSLMAVMQWIRICLPMQGTRVQSLVWEDFTCHRATKPSCCNSWSPRLEPVLSLKRGYDSEKPGHHNEGKSTPIPQLEKVLEKQCRPSNAKNKQYVDLKKKNTGMGCHFLLYGLFLTQGSNPYILH